jgi:hypothetical protein
MLLVTSATESIQRWEERDRFDSHRGQVFSAISTASNAQGFDLSFEGREISGEIKYNATSEF